MIASIFDNIRKYPIVFATVLLILYVAMFGLSSLLSSIVAILIIAVFLAVIVSGDLDNDWFDDDDDDDGPRPA